MKQCLDEVVARYHHPEYLGSDPLTLVHKVKGAEDQVFAAWLVGLLSYGNVKLIQRAASTVLDLLDWQPRTALDRLNFSDPPTEFTHFKYRFTDGEDILCLLFLLRQAAGDGTLEEFFLAGYDKSDPDISTAAASFVTRLLAQDFGPFNREHMLSKGGFRHLLSDPGKGSACKRIYLILRWLVRRNDGVDLGHWTQVDPAKLLMPVDVHILRISRHLGWTTKRSADLVCSREITKKLRRLDPADPVRYDFSLCRIGILKQCPARTELAQCNSCGLHSVCKRRKQLQARTKRLGGTVWQ